jgi:uncharacterized protein YggE
MRPTLLAAVVAALVSLALRAAAQGDGPEIVTTGEGLSVTPAAFVVFAFTGERTGPDAATAVSGAADTVARLRTRLEERENAPAAVEQAAAGTPRWRDGGAGVSFRVVARFSVAGLERTEDGPGGFAALCDAMRALADDVGAQLADPELRPADPEAVEREAVLRAMEAAYPQAEAAAEAIQAPIVDVQTVRVIATTWSPPGYPATVSAMTCRARVQVTYVTAL